MPDFLKQGTQPLFPDILWNRPVNKRAAKTLLIVGGHRQQIQQTQDAYQAARTAGIGQAKVVLPDVLQSVVGKLEDALLVPSTSSGSLARSAFEPIIGFSKEADGVLLVGEFSRNPETTSLIESLLIEITKPIALTGEVMELMLHKPESVVAGEKLVVAKSQQLVKLAAKLKINIAISSFSSLLNKIELLKQLSAKYPINYALLGNEVIVSSQGKISVTEVNTSLPASTAYLSVFWLQQAKTFEALTTAAHTLG